LSQGFAHLRIDNALEIITIEGRNVAGLRHRRKRRPNPTKEERMLTKEAVEKIINDRIRPAIMMDGGNIELVKVEDDKVFVRLMGACGHCPGAVMTLQMGVERILRHELPDVKGVVRV